MTVMTNTHFRFMAPAPVCISYRKDARALYLTFLSWECNGEYCDVKCHNWTTRKVVGPDLEAFSTFLDETADYHDDANTFEFPEEGGYLFATHGGNVLEFRSGSKLALLPKGTVIASMDVKGEGIINCLKHMMSEIPPETFRGVKIPPDLSGVSLHYWKRGVDSALDRDRARLPNWGLDRLND